MAALSRPSLRSSSRQNTALDEAAVSPATVKPGKRLRYTSSVDQDLKSFKKHKANALALPIRNPTVPPHRTKSSAEPGLKVGNAPSHHLDTVANSDDTQPPFEDSSSTSPRRQSFSKRHDHAADGADNSITIDKRSLRSHDGSAHLKSELSQYFSNYDEILSTEVKEPGGSPSPILFL